MTATMIELLETMLGLGGEVTSGTWWALPFHARTRSAVVARGWVQSFHAFPVLRTPYRVPQHAAAGDAKSPPGTELVALSGAGVWVHRVTSAGRAAVGDWHAADRADGVASAIADDARVRGRRIGQAMTRGEG